MPLPAKFLTAALITAALLAAATSQAAADPVAGFQTLEIAGPAGPRIEAAVWYPARAEARPMRLGLGTQVVAPGAAIAGEALPLVVVSHGNGGSLAGHADTAQALAEAGFVVAALTHVGDNYRDQSRATDMPKRSRELGLLLDHMLTRWADRDRLDAGRVGAFGFSSGGFTVLTAAGAVPDPSLILEHCQGHLDFYDCRLAAKHLADPSAWGGWRQDRRIRALVAAAPALGYALAGGLDRVDVPLQLWQAELDEVLPAPFYVEPVLAGLPRRPEYHLVREAGHFDFLTPCARPEDAPALCRSRAGFDPAAFHRTFNGAVVRFFQAALAPR